LAGCTMTVCRCHLSFQPPEDVESWRPERDADPGPTIRAVALVGQDPTLCRAVRVPIGWSERGDLVNFYLERTPPLPWWRVGECWAGEFHPVVSVEP